MDPHSDYLAPVEKRAFDERMSSEFFGIGAQLTKDDYGIKIASIITGGAAYKSGQIVVNDLIIKVAQGSGDPVDVSAYATEDAVKLIRGNKGTEVRLTLKKEDGTIKVVSLIREKVNQDQGLARSSVIQQGAKKIGYIILPDFYSNFEDANGHHCSEDVAEELKKLKAEKVDGIVIDIRYNGGGSLYEVVKMVGLFIKSGPIVQVKDRSGNVDQMTWRDNDESILYDGPLAVLVNEFSASASDIGTTEGIGDVIVHHQSCGSPGGRNRCIRYQAPGCRLAIFTGPGAHQLKPYGGQGVVGDRYCDIGSC
jgi:carboxyl-terminal processing protease